MQQLAAFLMQLALTVHLASFNYKAKQTKKLIFLHSQQLNDNFGRFFLFSSAQFCFQDLIMERIKQGQNIHLAEDFCDNLQQI